MAFIDATRTYLDGLVADYRDAYQEAFSDAHQLPTDADIDEILTAATSAMDTATQTARLRMERHRQTTGVTAGLYGAQAELPRQKARARENLRLDLSIWQRKGQLQRWGSDATTQVPTPLDSQAQNNGGSWPPGIGDLIDNRFRITRELGRGGMGQVYEATDERLGRQVAIKTLSVESVSDHTARERFFQEVRAAQDVTHENVCHVYDLGMHSLHQVDGTILEGAFFSMELLKGPTLKSRLATVGRLTPQQSLPVIRQLARGLDAAHKAKLVHRDLKPGNIFLEPQERDGEERLVITDFGLAKLLDSDAESLTATGQFLGTPAYMSPEQFMDVTPKPTIDIWALGVIVFEMTTGRRPFQGSPLEILAAIKAAPPRPKSIAPHLSQDWEEAILKCLRQDPQERFQTAAHAIAALESGVEGSADSTTDRNDSLGQFLNRPEG